MVRQMRGRPGREASLGIAGYEHAVEVRRDRCGVVFAAEDTEAGHPVEVRLLRVSALDASTREELRHRLRALETIPAHPHLARVFATGVTDAGRGYVVGAGEPGGTLASRVAERGGLPWQRIARIGASVAAGMEVAHAAGVLHGGIRGECILLSALDEPRIADLGVAQVLSLLDSREGGGREALSAEADVTALAFTLRAGIRGAVPEALIGTLDAAVAGDTTVSAAALGRGLEAALASVTPGPAAPEAVEAVEATPPPPVRSPLSTRRGRIALAAGAIALSAAGMVLAPRLARDMVRVSAPAAPVDASARVATIDPAHWAPGSRWNRSGPALAADRAAAHGVAAAPTQACGADVGSLVYSFEAPRLRAGTYAVGAWLSSNVGRLTASPDAFSDVSLIVNGAEYASLPAGAVSARGQYFEWRVRGGDVHGDGPNTLEYAVEARALHRHGLCIHFGAAGVELAQAITVRSLG